MPVLSEAKLRKGGVIDIDHPPNSLDPRSPMYLYHDGKLWDTYYPAEDDLSTTAESVPLRRRRKLEILNKIQPKGFYAPAKAKDKKMTPKQVHETFNHPGKQRQQELRKMLEREGYEVSGSDMANCMACDLAKPAPFPSRDQDESKRQQLDPGESWAHDLGGKMRVVAVGCDGGKYRSLTIDEFLGMEDLRIVKKKGEAALHIMQLHQRNTCLPTTFGRADRKHFTYLLLMINKRVMMIRLNKSMIQSPSRRHFPEKFGNWKDSYLGEIYNMEDNNWIELVDTPPPPQKFPTTFRFNTKADGHKRSRMGFRGDLQEQYGESYASVISKQSLKILLTDAALNDDDLVLADIGQAFCETKRSNDNPLYIFIPPGYNEAAHQFGLVMTNFFVEYLGFASSAYDSQYFVKHLDNGRTIAAGIHIDDSCIRCTPEDKEWIKARFTQRFKKISWNENPSRVIDGTYTATLINSKSL
ncbi:hypothetical protein HDV05_002070 [Chytridiales sp. JEL 0842]|nr:hypothetical protein HDV05_002070 [Chytridiales sp. JEL 0842]